MPHDPFAQGVKDPCEHYLLGHAVLVMVARSTQSLYITGNEDLEMHRTYIAVRDLAW